MTPATRILLNCGIGRPVSTQRCTIFVPPSRGYAPNTTIASRAAHRDRKFIGQAPLQKEFPLHRSMLLSTSRLFANLADDLLRQFLLSFLNHVEPACSN